MRTVYNYDSSFTPLAGKNSTSFAVLNLKLDVNQFPTIKTGCET